MNTKSILRGALSATVCSAVLGLASVGAAQVTNGSFETGTYSGWTTLGDTFIATSSIGTNPTDGTYQALLATATDGTGGYAPGTGTSSVSTMESFLGVTSGSLAGIGNGPLVLGTAIKQSFSMIAGEKLTFNWDFLTNQTYNDGTGDSVPPELNNDDYSFVSVVKPNGNSSVSKLADVFYNGFTITPDANPFISQSGYQTFSMTATVTGTYTLGIGVVHASTGDEDGVNSGLLVDNVEATPEPVSLIGLAGLCVGAAVRKRRQSRS